MSSLRNAVKRRTHKERAQPAARHRFGLLEKKKDYLLRAKNFHKQEDTLQVLRNKAEMRNPDEFYTAMQRDAHHSGNRDTARFTNSQIKALKDQDLLAVKLQTNKVKKRLERMQGSLHFIGAPASKQHMVFVDSRQEAASFSAEDHFDTPNELLDRSFNRPRRAQLEQQLVAQTSAVAAEQAPDRLVARQAKRRASAYQNLLQQRQVAEKLDGIVAEMAVKRTAMQRGRKQPVKGEAGGVIGYKFKKSRQK